MNLLICHTPYQVLLSEKIISKFPNDDFHCIMFSYSKNQKIDFYFKRLSQKCKTNEIIFINNGFHQKICTIKLRLKYLGRQFNKVFLASIDSIVAHSILSSITFQEIRTFDDGAANILPTSFFYINKKNVLHDFIKKCLLISYDLESVKNLSKLHYTVYSLPNIIQKTEKLHLFEDFLFDSHKKQNSISILIGQPLFKEKKKNISLFSAIKERYGIIYYFPHPRENYQISNIEYIHTQCIFEDYIMELLKDYQNVNLYTVYSSVVLNLSEIDRVNVYVIKNPTFYKEQEILNGFNFKFLNGVN